MTHVDRLNRTLRERLGSVCGGSLPRFSWKFAPEVPWFVYDTDDRTIVKKSWADAPGPDGRSIGKVWLIAEWRVSSAFDHMGFGDGVRIARAHEAGYAPYFETTLSRGQEPTEEATAWIIHKLDRQLSMSAGVIGDDESLDQFMAEEVYTEDRNRRRFANENYERSAAEYDKWTGAFGNLEPGPRDGWMEWGGIGDSPMVKKIQEAPGEATVSQRGVVSPAPG